MSSPRTRRATSIGLGLFTWALLALFVALERDRAERDRAMAVGAVAFVSYLIAIGYAIYARTHSQRPAVAETRRGPSAVVIWITTILALSAFGVTIGVLFPNLMRSYTGELFVQSVCFGGVALGLVLTVTRDAPRGATAEPPAPFWRAALRLVAWQIAAALAGIVLFGPMLLFAHQLQAWIDIPACQQLCEAKGLSFSAFSVSKTSYNCTCNSTSGHVIFHERAHIGGGHSWASALMDWLLRSGALLVVGIGWPLCLFFMVAKLRKVITRRER